MISVKSTATQSIWSVYLIKTNSNTLYAGVTTDVARRYQEHVSGKQKSARYLRGKGPLTLVWHQEIGHKQLAMSVEYQLKRIKAVDKWRLIHGDISLVDLFPALMGGSPELMGDFPELIDDFPELMGDKSE
ncbi:GIY-YIG nuclease family protein [Marinomonas agarivorans]|nr:GIY-YIG nuclease family protein [Marinomonas agarivorans]